MLTRQEKERLVRELYNQGKTIRDIAKELRMSFRDIGTILRKESGEKQNEKQLLLSSSTQAYRLFSEGKTPIEVAIALDLVEFETTKYYEEYLNLKQMHELRMVYDEIGPDVMHFLELYKLSKDAHMKPEHVVNLLQVSNRYLPLVQQKYKKLMKETDSLESEKQKLHILWSQIRLSINTLDNYKKEIKNLQRQKLNLGILINSGRYKKVRQIAEKEVNNSLSKPRDILKLAVATVLESLRQNPDKYNFLINTNKYYGGQYAASQSYIDAYRTMILDESQKLFELMERGLTSGIINEPTLTIPS
jgi:predicted transcriptional regulator